MLKHLLARLSTTATTAGADDCMRLEWVRDILRSCDPKLYTAELLDDGAFVRLVRLAAYKCLGLCDAAALVCTGRLSLWIRARMFCSGADAREAVAVFAVLGAKPAPIQVPVHAASASPSFLPLVPVDVVVRGRQVLGAFGLRMLRRGARCRERAGGGGRHARALPA